MDRGPKRQATPQDAVKIEYIVQSTDGVSYLDFSSLLEQVEAEEATREPIKEFVKKAIETPQAFEWQPHLDTPKPFATRTYLEDKPLLVSMIRFYNASAASEEVKKQLNHNIAELLVRLGADVNATSKQGDTALFYAVGSADLAMITFLKDQGANVSATDGKDKTLLHEAVASGDLTTVKTVMAWKNPDVSSAIDINAQDKAGKTALFYAVGSADLAMITFLKDQGANVSATDGKDKTLLHEAVASGDLTTLQTVMEWKNEGGSPAIDINAQDKTGNTALSYALNMPERKNRTINLMLTNGADVMLLNHSDQDELLTGLLTSSVDHKLLGKTYPVQLYTLLQEKIWQAVSSRQRIESRRDKKSDQWVYVKRAFGLPREASEVSEAAEVGGAAAAEAGGKRSPTLISDPLMPNTTPLDKVRLAVQILQTFLGAVPAEPQGAKVKFGRSSGRGKTRKRALGGDVLRQNLITFLKKTATHLADCRRSRSITSPPPPSPKGGAA